MMVSLHPKFQMSFYLKKINCTRLYLYMEVIFIVLSLAQRKKTANRTGFLQKVTVWQEMQKLTA